jgi:hypothetical protein
MRKTIPCALLLVTLLQGCVAFTRTAVRTTSAGREEPFQCLPRGGTTRLPLLTTFAGSSIGAFMVLIPAMANFMGSDQPDLPPFIQIGAVTGLVVGLATVAVVRECPQLPRGPRNVDSASFGPAVRIVIADRPLINDADARIVRKVGERDVIIFWTTGFTPRSLSLALVQLDHVRRLEGDSTFRAANHPFRSPLTETPRERELATYPEGRQMLDAERRQATTAYDDLMSRRSGGARHNEPGIGEGVYVDIIPLRHRRIASARPDR